ASRGLRAPGDAVFILAAATRAVATSHLLTRAPSSPKHRRSCKLDYLCRALTSIRRYAVLRIDWPRSTIGDGREGLYSVLLVDLAI
ncbi:hypothetical protein C8Q78DRAFT_1007185, partial [Trametes maxima]